ncbi:unnamed protein product [Eruca vesicaria subsp. sativa]|uniref:Uncharacterized protein n=1 Tax=Eruca vesicaria subsp. sativa TaxID=29727 RepID=A0ABC8IN39_ERUVS|nr:unnamed protein product [Eruca vesicaria subsp. sativa]
MSYYVNKHQETPEDTNVTETMGCQDTPEETNVTDTMFGKKHWMRLKSNSSYVHSQQLYRTKIAVRDDSSVFVKNAITWNSSRRRFRDEFHLRCVTEFAFRKIQFLVLSNTVKIIKTYDGEKDAATKAAFDATFDQPTPLIEPALSSTVPESSSESDSDSDDESDYLLRKLIGPVDPSKSTASGAGRGGGTACAPPTFIVVTKDFDGRRVPNGGALIRVSVSWCGCWWYRSRGCGERCWRWHCLGGDSHRSEQCLQFARMYVANRASDKITQLTDNVYVCRSGSAAGSQVVSDCVCYFLHQHTIQLGQPATVKVSANLIRMLAYNNKVESKKSPLMLSSSSPKGLVRQNSLLRTPKTPQAEICDSESQLESLPMDLLVLELGMTSSQQMI